MGTLLKLLLAILAGYVAAVLAGVMSFGELHPGGVLYLLWVVIMFTLPITPPAIAGYFLLAALAMFAFLLRRKPFWPHAGITMIAGLSAAAIISWLVTLNGPTAKSLFSITLIPVAAAALAIVACVRVPFPSLSAKTDSLEVAAKHRRSSVVVSALLVITVGVLFTWLLQRHHETKIWNNVEARLRPVVIADERFRYVRMDRARDGSVFLFGAVESPAALDALHAAVENARLERTPGNVVTVSGPVAASGTGIIRTPAARR
jgi:hypothetical protein